MDIYNGLFLNCDGKRLYFKGDDDRTVTMDVNNYHTPYCLVICDDNITEGRYRDTTDAVVAKIEERIREVKEDHDRNNRDDPYRFILTDDRGLMMYTNASVYRSFHNPCVRYRCIEVHATMSWKIPAISTVLFKDMGMYSAEFDIPYRDRALIDIQGENRVWLFDTGGNVRKLKVLAYDIETTQYDPTEQKDDGAMPVDMLGWAIFEITYRAERDPSTGKCVFELVSLPDWEAPEIHQMVGHDIGEEAALLVRFIELVLECDIIAGHNIVQFDNRQIYNRLQYLRGYRLDDRERWVQERGAPNHIPEHYSELVSMFLDERCKPTNIFFYGDMQNGVDIYPLSFDTLFAAKRLYFFLSEYNLKALAQTFGYHIEDRVYLDPINQSIETPVKEKKTLKYNEHDVREQIGVTAHLLADAMRLCHLTGMTFNDCMPAGTTKIWDTMTHICSHTNRRIMPAIAPASWVSKELFHKFGTHNPKTGKPYTKIEVSELARRALDSTLPLSERTMKVMRYGIEAPDYVMYPQLVHNPYSKKNLHAITTRNCGCKDCRDRIDLKHCDCVYCKGLRNKYPDGLNSKEEQAGFVVGELKKAGHPESDEDLLDFVLADRGFRDKEIGYHFPGGLTVHPAEVHSEFKMWWGIIITDFSSMYPLNLKAEDIGGDTARFAHPRYYRLVDDHIEPKKNSPFAGAKENYKWIWLKRVRYDVVKNFFIGITAKNLHAKPEFKELSKEFRFVDRGYLIAIVIDAEPGGISQGMDAVLDVTGRIKKRKGQIMRPDSGATDRERKQIAGSYQSIKSMRNSGSVDASRSIKLISPNGEYVEKNISDIYNMFQVDVIRRDIDGIPFEIKDISDTGWRGVTVTENGKVRIRSVVNVIRHLYDGDMVNIYVDFKNKRRLVGMVTPNHSILEFHNSKIRKVLPLDAEKCVVVCKAEWGCFGFDRSSSEPFPDWISFPYDICETTIASPTTDYVYDLEMEGNHNFVDASGLLLENTHGILSAPTVSCRQFNLAGAARITTLGQCVLDDTMETLKQVNARFVYGDTDGIYLATATHAGAVIDGGRRPMCEIFGIEPGETFFDPALIEQTVANINTKWRNKLNYPPYELEIGHEDGMLFAKHKNYLKFHHKITDDGECKLTFKTKGNNFDAKDKPKIDKASLERIMRAVIDKHLVWDDEEAEFLGVRADIKEMTRTVVDGLNPDEMDPRHFTVRQSIQPVGAYKTLEKECSKCEGDGCVHCANTGHRLNAYAARANAMARLLEMERMKSTIVVQCVVCVNPLPLREGARKSGTKPISFLWPIDLLEDEKYRELSGGIDFDWYKDSVFEYIKGAFAFDDWNLKPWRCTLKQMTLDGGFMVKLVTGTNYAKKGKFAAGRSVACSKEMFDRLKVDTPISDDVMEHLMNTNPELLEGFGWGGDNDE